MTDLSKPWRWLGPLTIAIVVLGCAAPAGVDSSRALAERARAAGVPLPIVDAHIHLYEVTRPGGVPYPPAAMKPIYRDVLPAEFKRVAAPLGIVGAGVVEASLDVADNQWILDRIAADNFFLFFVGALEVGAPTFSANLERLAQSPKFVGIRAFRGPWKLSLDDAQRGHLAELAGRGMVLEVLTLQPEQILEIAKAAPTLKIVINHLGRPKGPAVDPGWAQGMRKLAATSNVAMKFSSYFDIYGAGNAAWQAPTDLSSYRPFFDVIYEVFGPDRLIFASNWPVNEMGGSIAAEVALAEEYLSPRGQEVRDKVMYRNALRIYRR